MKWSAHIEGIQDVRFEIESQTLRSITDDQTQVGYYLYVWKNDKCTHDYLQDTLNAAMRQAFEQFGVPLKAWSQTE